MYDYNNSNSKSKKQFQHEVRVVLLLQQLLLTWQQTCLHLACLAYLTSVTFLASVGYFLTILSLERSTASPRHKINSCHPHK